MKRLLVQEAIRLVLRAYTCIGELSAKLGVHTGAAFALLRARIEIMSLFTNAISLFSVAIFGLKSDYLLSDSSFFRESTELKLLDNCMCQLIN